MDATGKGAPALLRRDDGGVVWYEVRGEGWRAAFSTRLGGVSPAPYDSLNLGYSTADLSGNVARNRRLFALAAGHDPDDLVVPGQVHGTHVATVGESLRGRGARGPATVISRHRRPAHGCRRSAAAGQLRRLRPRASSPRAGRPAPSRSSTPAGAAWSPASSRRRRGLWPKRRESVRTPPSIGPSIGPCCFAVSPDVGERFEAVWPGTWHDGRVDLWAAARRQLISAGVRESAILTTGLCTCHEARVLLAPQGSRLDRQAGGDSVGHSRRQPARRAAGGDMVTQFKGTAEHVRERFAEVRERVDDVARDAGRQGADGRDPGRHQVRGGGRHGHPRRGRRHAGRREPRSGPRRQARALRRHLRLRLHRSPAEPQDQARAAARAAHPLGLDA